MIKHVFHFEVGFNGSVTMTSGLSLLEHHGRPARIDGVPLIVLILLSGVSKI
jgi:hypothetical protein